jgi:hypothetical protein
MARGNGQHQDMADALLVILVWPDGEVDVTCRVRTAGGGAAGRPPSVPPRGGRADRLPRRAGRTVPAVTAIPPQRDTTIHCCVCLQGGRMIRAAVILDGYAACERHWKATQDSGHTMQQLLLAAHHRRQKGQPV